MKKIQGHAFTRKCLGPLHCISCRVKCRGDDDLVLFFDNCYTQQVKGQTKEIQIFQDNDDLDINGLNGSNLQFQQCCSILYDMPTTGNKCP